MNKTPKFPLGESDFASVRQGQFEYVDKSLFIQDVIEDSAEVLLFPRPRRFGKTLNLSMLKYFFEKSQENRRGLFSGLQIEQEKEAFTHFQKYPVIFLTFKDVKFSSWAEYEEKIKELLSELYTNHLEIKEKLLDHEQAYFDKVLYQTSSTTELSSALWFLSKHLEKYHGEKVVILIDEYDTCIHSTYTDSYYEQAISFFKNFLSGGLKDNPYLFKGVVTGILRIAKESIFSGLNNLAVYSILHQAYSSFFGFTELEVSSLAEHVNQTHLLPELKAWYNGYLFGKQTIYNPWSILRYLNQPEEGFQPYWVQTSSNNLIRKLLFDAHLPIRTEIETLLQGGSIEKPISENTVFSDLEKQGEALWSFLLFSGYLTVESLFEKQEERYGRLRLVNQEIRREFRSITRIWLEQEFGYSVSLEKLLKSLFSGKAEEVEETLAEIMKVHLSFFDVPEEKDKPAASTKKTRKSSSQSSDYIKQLPERIYHVFVLGMLLNLSSEYDVRSNAESGYGRPDLLLLPKVPGKPGVVFEFKVVSKGKTVDSVMKEALQQLDNLAYETELKQRDAHPIYQYAAVFSGKKVRVHRKK